MDFYVERVCLISQIAAPDPYLLVKLLHAPEICLFCPITCRIISV